VLKTNFDKLNNTSQKIINRKSYSKAQTLETPDRDESARQLINTSQSKQRLLQQQNYQQRLTQSSKSQVEQRASTIANKLPPRFPTSKNVPHCNTQLNSAVKSPHADTQRSASDESEPKGISGSFILKSPEIDHSQIKFNMNTDSKLISNQFEKIAPKFRNTDTNQK